MFPALAKDPSKNCLRDVHTGGGPPQKIGLGTYNKKSKHGGGPPQKIGLGTCNKKSKHYMDANL